MTGLETKQAPRRRRGLLVVGALALGLTAIGVGAVYSQPYGWGGGQPYGGPGHGGWGGHGQGGPMQGGPMQGMPRRGWMMGFGPERMIEFALSSVGATSEQKLKIVEIAQAAMNDLRPLRDRRYTAGLKLAILLKAETVDRGAIERLRAEEMGALDAGTKRAAQAVADAAEVLTPAQRQQLVQRWENRFNRRG